MPLIAANGVELFHEIDGPADAPVIAFSNSLAARTDMWTPQVAALSDRYRCVRYETRGHGRSPVVDRPATIDDLANDLAGLLDALGIATAHIVGLSLGGMTAQAMGILHPGRVRSLSLLATAACLPPPSNWQERMELARREGMAPIAALVMNRWFTEPFHQSSPQVVAPIREGVLKTDPRGYAVCAGVLRDMDLRPRLSAVTAPTLIMVGSQDHGTPPALAEEIRGLIPHADMVVIARAAHMLTLERPDAVNAYLAAFLDRMP